jgi:hypothetical protein
MSAAEEAAWLAAQNERGVQEMIGDRVLARCRRCGGPLFQTGDADWGLCLTHGEQFIGTVIEDLTPPTRSEAKRKRWVR